MDFELTADQRLLQETVRRFVVDRVAPGAGVWDRTEQLPPEVVQEVSEMGLLGVVVAPEYDGAGLAATDLALVVEELACGDGALALTVASHNALCATHIQRFGTEAQKRRYLPMLARGEALGAWAFAEPDGDLQRWTTATDERAPDEDAAAALCTAAERDGDRWRINGQKTRVTHGSAGQLLIIVARADCGGRDGLVGDRVAAFIAEKGTAGLVQRPIRDRLGLRAADTADLSLDDLLVPEENRLGQLDAGRAETAEVLAHGCIAMAALAVGIGRGALDQARSYALERQQFGKPIAEFQAIQWMLADVATELDAARLLVHRASWRADSALPFGRQAAMAKLLATEAAMRAADAALQILGGVGYTADFPVERHYRDAELCCVSQGTGETQRLVVARHVLREMGL